MTLCTTSAAAMGGKGHDFASFWVIQRVTELEQAKPTDYLFVCEYMQDVAEFDSSTAPTRVRHPAERRLRSTITTRPKREK